MIKNFVFVVEDEFTQEKYVFRDSQNAKKFVYNQVKQNEYQVIPFGWNYSGDPDVIEKFYTEEEFLELSCFEINEIVDDYYYIQCCELMD